MAALSTDDRSRIARTVKQYASWSTRDIVHESYRLLPQTALRSEMAADLLSGAELQAVQATKPKPSAPGLYTIGYEGLDIDAFLNKLLGAGITLLCDVRRNAQSMKYGYSRKQLEKYCKSAGIRYLPSSGARHCIGETSGTERPRGLPQAVHGVREALPARSGLQQENLLFDVQMEHRVADRCAFKADPDCCHRSHLADSLAGLSAGSYTYLGHAPQGPAHGNHVSIAFEKLR